MSLRGLARQIGVSASAMSQIETGRSRPSVSTLYAITNALDMSLDQLFNPEPASPLPPVPDKQRWEPNGSQHRAAAAISKAPEGPVQRGGQRAGIDLETRVRWERLTAERDPDVDFLYVIYDVGGASSRDRVFVRHAGREYGLVLTGRLRVTLGFDMHELGPGDSISFDSSTPHLLENVGEEQVTAIWVSVGRHVDPRLGERGSAHDSWPH